MAHSIGIDPNNREYGIERDDDWNDGGDPLGAPEEDHEPEPDVDGTTPPEDNPADEIEITQPEYEAGEPALLTAGPWQLEDLRPRQFDGAVCLIHVEGKPVARVFTTRADAMAMRCAADWWEALNAIGFPAEGATVESLAELARVAMGKR